MLENFQNYAFSTDNTEIGVCIKFIFIDPPHLLELLMFPFVLNQIYCSFCVTIVFF